MAPLFSKFTPSQKKQKTSLRLSILLNISSFGKSLSKKTEIRLTASKSKLHISASKSEKSIKISAYLCDGGVRFEQVATRKIIV